MQRTARLLRLAALAAVLVASSDLAAQRISSPYRFVERSQDLGLFVGYIFGNQGVAGLGLKGGPTIGGQWGIRLSDPLQITVVGAYLNSERDVINPRSDSGVVVLGTTPQDLVLISARLHMNLTGARTWHNLIPYFYGGIGFAIDVTGEPGAICLNAPQEDIRCQVSPEDRYNFKSSFLVQFGFGTVWLPFERWGLRFQLQDNLWRIRTPDGWFDPDLELDPFPPDVDWTNNIQVSVGLHYWY